MEAPATASPAVRSSPWWWASFLGASWTWVIGMFLPVLLIRDYGIWAWVIFAVPNVVGAAAMGWVMKSREQSYAFVRRHADAARLFSLVTIAFHLFFSLWVLPKAVGPIGFVVALIVVQLSFTPLKRVRVHLVWSAITLLASVAVAVVLQRQGALSLPPVQPFGAMDVAGLIAVCVAGFALCPYLDLTFHQARQATTDRGAKIAFGVGFGVMFFSMIVLTLFFARTATLQPYPNEVVRWAMFAHWSLQIIFTVCVHSAALHAHPDDEDDSVTHCPLIGVWLAIGFIAGLIALVTMREDLNLTYGKMPIGEVLYRCFMAFYGLVVPAYIATHWRAAGKRTLLWLLAMVLALPFYWIAFMHPEHMGWFLPGVGILALSAVLSWLLGRKRGDGVACGEPTDELSRSESSAST